MDLYVMIVVSFTITVSVHITTSVTIVKIIINITTTDIVSYQRHLLATTVIIISAATITITSLAFTACLM